MLRLEDIRSLGAKVASFFFFDGGDAAEDSAVEGRCGDGEVLRLRFLDGGDLLVSGSVVDLRRRGDSLRRVFAAEGSERRPQPLSLDPERSLLVLRIRPTGLREREESRRRRRGGGEGERLGGRS